MLLLQTLGTNFWFPPKKPKPCSDLPPLCRPASGPAANLELLNVCKFRRGPRNRSCSLDVYLLSQRMLNFFIGLMLGTPFGFLLLVPFRAAFEDGLGALLPLWYQGQLL